MDARGEPQRRNANPSWGALETGQRGDGPPKPPRKKRPGVATQMRFLDALLALGTYVAVQFVVGIVVVVVLLTSGGVSAEDVQAGGFGPWTVLALVVVAGLAALCGVGLVALVRGLGPRGLGLRPVSPRWLLAGLGVCAVGVLVNIAVVSAYVRVTGDESDPQAALMGVSTGGSSLQFALMLILGGLLAPIGEELLFRGILFAWLRRWGLPLGVGLSSVVFGLFHGFNFVFFTAAILGAMLALLYEYSGSLWPSIVAHAANNIFSFVVERVIQ